MNENVNLIQKLEQGRAEFAYNCVKDALNKLDSRRQKEYKSYVPSFYQSPKKAMHMI